MFFFFRNINPEIQELREAGLKSAVEQAYRDKKLINDLVQYTYGVHASWLFHPCGIEVLQELCLSLSYVSLSDEGSWYNLTGILEISWKKIRVIIILIDTELLNALTYD